MIDPLIRLIRDLGAQERVVLTSFAHGPLAEIRARGYRGPTGMSRREITQLVLTPTGVLRRLGVAGQRAQVPTSTLRVQFGSRWFVEKCHALGVAVDFWTIDDPVEARRLLDLGADGIVTNDPAALASLFEAPFSP